MYFLSKLPSSLSGDMPSSRRAAALTIPQTAGRSAEALMKTSLAKHPRTPLEELPLALSDPPPPPKAFSTGS